MGSLLAWLRRVKIDRTMIIAVIVVAVSILWFVSGELNRMQVEAKVTPPLANQHPTVSVTQSEAKPYEAVLTVRGRTEASRKVDLLAETAGTVAEVPVAKGTPVVAGQVICRLAVEAREAELVEARAAAEQRRLEFVASEALGRKGNRSTTQVAASRAAYEGAQALVKRMEMEIARTEIRAPFDGVLDTRPTEVGDYLKVGDVCGTVVDANPLLIVAQVSEREVPYLKVGGPGRAKLITGQMLEGQIRFIASAAEPQTRTFRVELAVANPMRLQSLRDGITSDLMLPVATLAAHRFSPSILTLNDAGELGVRILEPGNIARFKKVDPVGQDADGIWVRGLPDRVSVITTGQDFVGDGEVVNPVEASSGTSS